MRINGSLLPKCINKHISITGTVKLVHPNNMAFNMESTDGVNVIVNLSKPVGSDFNGLVEVDGTVQSPSTILCDSYLIFPYNIVNSFDPVFHNAVINLMFYTPNAWR